MTSITNQQSLIQLAQSILEEIADTYAEDNEINLDNEAYQIVFDRISDTILSDNDAISVIAEIDLEAEPDGETLFRAIQKAAEDKVLGHVLDLIREDSRFKKDDSQN
jgi:hypothetical protein